MGTEGWAEQALAGAKPAVFWSDRDDVPPLAPALKDDTTADLTIIGGGFTGLWAAIRIRACQSVVGVQCHLSQPVLCGC